ncbi:MAG: hypothetical protein HN403_01605 [Rhodospirillales bacterium]|mgnify:FL=1|jgi:hypothetical protein|nr:hypothetical protein [Rhodospirillales bacterium]
MGKLYCGTIFSSTAPSGEVATWLQANCEGQWDLLPASVAGDGVTKKFMILFEEENDRSNFETCHSVA